MSASQSDAGPSEIRKRKRRIHLNCAECRRLKLKCDRSVPCANCVKRDCPELCPGEARETQKKVVAKDTTRPVDLHKHVQQLHQVLFEHGIQPPEWSIDRTGVLDVPVTLPERVVQMTPADLPLPTVNLEPDVAPHTDAIPQEDPTTLLLNQHFQSPSNAARESPGQRSSAAGTVDIFSGGLVLSPSVTEPGHGTLVLSRSGRSKYLGPSAASEWLKDQEVYEHSRPPSPKTRLASRETSPLLNQPHLAIAQAFPFEPHRQGTMSFASLLQALPGEDEINALVEAYFRYFTWCYDPIPRKQLDTIVEDLLQARTNGTPSSAPKAQQLGLVFIVLALGTLYSLEVPIDDPMAEDYCAYSRVCLTKGQFMTYNTLACVQTLCLMAHFHLASDRGRNGDLAWPLWGFASQISQAMGLHRDGAKWRLSADILDDRRRVFWEYKAPEVFQAHCFSRPTSIAPEFIDTLLPSDAREWHRLKWELCKISQAILYHALSVNPQPIGRLEELGQQLLAFERNLPFGYKCRAAFASMPSIYPDITMIEKETPSVSRRDMRRTFEQYFLSMVISEQVVNLYRGSFVQAVMENPENPANSTHAQAFLSVVERSTSVIQVSCGLYELHPNVAIRQWWLWYHSFNSAVLIGTLLSTSPRSEFAAGALAHVDKVIAMYTTALQSNPSRRLALNLRWLLHLRQRGVAKINATPDAPPGNDDDDMERDAGLLGWRTRLIERVAHGSQKATTIASVSNDIPSLDFEAFLRSMPKEVQEHLASDENTNPLPQNLTTGDQPLPSFTDQLLRELCDPDASLQLAADPRNLAWWTSMPNEAP